MRISDWSSDVCSSDLEPRDAAATALLRSEPGQEDGGARDRAPVDLCLDPASAQGSRLCDGREKPLHPRRKRALAHRLPRTLLRTLRSEERRVGKSVSVRVDLGGRRIIKKKTRNKKYDQKEN